MIGLADALSANKFKKAFPEKGNVIRKWGLIAVENYLFIHVWLQ